MQATWVSWACACVVLLARSPWNMSPTVASVYCQPERSELFKFVVAIVGGAGVGSVNFKVQVLVLLEEELARRGGVAEDSDRATDADRRLFRR